MNALPSNKQPSFSLPELSLTCFGHFEMKRAGQPLAPCSNRNAQVVLRYLVAQARHSAPAEKLVAVIWPEDESEIAKNKLHIAISALRRSLHVGLPLKGQGYLVCHNHVYSLSSLAPIHTDAEEFQLYYQRGQQQEAERVACFEKACRLYTGPFLSEDLYADWSFLLREQYNQTYLTMCRALTEHYFQAHCYEKAAHWATLILAQDRCDEAAHRQLMHIYAAQGIRSKAIQQYHHCVQLLQRELGIQPLPVTTQLFQTLVDGKLPIA
jgi:DNA-binding SARP family transcriptional activator